jgi:hypothetical protein
MTMGINAVQPASKRPYGGIPVITITDVAPGAAVRIDTGAANRTAVSVHNLGDFGLWLGFDAGVAIDAGEYIPGSPTAGAHLGGFWAEELGSGVPIYATSEGGNNTVVVVEFLS